MGRENGEDYKADFNVMLNTWEGAVKYLNSKGKSVTGTGTTEIEIAKLLGWTRFRKKAKSNKLFLIANHIAVTCYSAHKLIEKKHIKREDLMGVPVSDTYQCPSPGVRYA